MSETGDTKWQPIETAPFNQSVLVFIPNAEHYGDGIYRALRPNFHDTPRGWQVTGLHFGRDCQQSEQPTHWMPLPSSPVSVDGKGPVVSHSEPKANELGEDWTQKFVEEYLAGAGTIGLAQLHNASVPMEHRPHKAKSTFHDRRRGEIGTQNENEIPDGSVPTS